MVICVAGTFWGAFFVSATPATVSATPATVSATPASRGGPAPFTISQCRKRGIVLKKEER